jgi:restriction system protein
MSSISPFFIMKQLSQGLLYAWPIFAACIVVVLIKFIYHIREQNLLVKSGINEIDKMDGQAFEKYLEALFTKLGYKVERTRYVGDYGADLVTVKNGVKTVIQAKRYKNKVHTKAIQEAVAAKGYYGCSQAMVVTNNFYTKQAEELAKSNGVLLWNRNDLLKVLLSIKSAEE